MPWFNQDAIAFVNNDLTQRLEMANRYILSLNFALSITLVTLGGLSHADGNVLKVAVPPFAPFAFFKEDDQCAGSSVAILNNIAQQLGLKFNHVIYPYSRILKSLKSGEIDIALIFKNASVEHHVDYIGPVSQSRVLVLTRLDNPIKQYNELTKLNSIAVIRKAHFEKRFDNDTQLNKSSVESYQQALKMFNFERVDAVVGSISGLEYTMKQLSMNTQLLESAFVLDHKEWWLHVSNKTVPSAMKQKLTRVVNSLYRPRLSYEVYKQQIEKCGI